MILDDSQPPEDGVLFVKSADGTPPDPRFERIMCYTFGDDPTEHRVRMHRDDTPVVIRESLKKLHQGIGPTTMLIAEGEVDDDWPMSDRISRTGTSDIHVSWRMERPYQKFRMWTTSEEIDLGDEALDGRPPVEMWASLKSRNPDLGKQTDYRMFVWQDEVGWVKLPVPNLVLVPESIPRAERGSVFHLVDLNSAPRPRSVGHLTQVSWQLSTNEQDPFSDPVVVSIPNEITLTQLVAAYIYRHEGGRLDINTVFRWCLEEKAPEDPRNKSAREVISIPDRIPVGFNLRVAANSLHTIPNGKRLVECIFGDAHFFVAMREDATVSLRRANIISQNGQEGPRQSVAGGSQFQRSN
jgi:hypothetical protein